jgi:hypothetical protein
VLVRFTLLEDVPSVVPFGPVMRMVWSRKPCLVRSFVQPWLTRRKQAGKICRPTLVLPRAGVAAQSATRRFLDSDQALNETDGRGTPLA